jgi:glycosyltransferase involved in cell wall biosynthesis
LSAESTPEVDKFTICYTGSLYRNFRDADVFFQTLSDIITKEKVDNIEFVYAGKDAQQFNKWIEKYNLGDYYRNLGYLPRSETLALQARSNIQLLLTSSSADFGGVLTGKLFEYLASGNPILAIIKGVYDAEFETLFSELSAGIICYDPPQLVDGMKHFILEHYRYWEKTGSINRTLNRDYILDHLSWSKQHDKMLAAIDL